MVKTKVLSKKYSLDNWSLLEWIKGNSSTMKEVLKVILSSLPAYSTTWSIPAKIVVFGAIKLACDVTDYYIKQQTE